MLLFNMKTTEYIILTLSNYTDSQLSDIDSVCLTSLALARKSNDLTKCLMKVQPDSTGTYPTQISSLTKYSLSEIETIIDIFSKNISNSLKKGNSVEIRGLGRFYVKKLKENVNARNPATNELIYKPERIKVRFRPAKKLKQIVNK